MKSALDIYYDGLKRCRFLSRDKERKLTERAKAGDREAKEVLIESLLPYVVRLATRFCAYHDYPLEDAIQSGNIGLMRAVEKFDPSRGRRLSTYATFHIRQKIRYDAENDSLIHVPHNVQQDHRCLSVTPEERAAAMSLKRAMPSLEGETEGRCDHEPPDEEAIAELRERIARLKEPGRTIIERRLAGVQLIELARERGCTKERVRQIEARALGALCRMYGRRAVFTMAKAMR